MVDYTALRTQVRSAVLSVGTRVILEARPVVTGWGGAAAVEPDATRTAAWGVIGQIKGVSSGGGIRTEATVTIAASPSMAAPVEHDRIFMPPGDETLVADGATVNGRWYEVQSVLTVAPGGETVVWVLEVAR